MARSEKNLTAVFNDTANAIRSKKGTSSEISPLDFADEISSIPTGITPSGTIPITTNGTHDVTNYASASVNVPAIYYFLSSGYAGGGGEEFVEDIMTDNRPGDCKSRIFSNSPSADYGGTIFIDNNTISLTMEWLSFDASSLAYEFDNLVDVRLLPGGHINTDLDEQFIVIGAIMDPDYITREYTYISFSIEYTNYYGSSTEEEVAQAWKDLLYSVQIKDLNGNAIGYIQNVDVNVTLRGSC